MNGNHVKSKSNLEQKYASAMAVKCFEMGSFEEGTRRRANTKNSVIDLTEIPIEASF